MTGLLQRVASAFRPDLRASPENPSTSLSNPAPWLSEALGASPTHSGVPVNERTALGYAPCFACINVLAKDLAMLPIFVYERKGQEREPARAHDVWRILHERPNPMMTPFTFKQTMHAHVVSWGNAYAEIETDGAGRVVNLWPLMPDRTKVQIKDGKKYVVTRVEGERWVGLPAEKVLHVPGLGFDGLQGYSVIHQARNAIGAGMATEEFGARLFQNGATPRLALKAPNKLTPDARVNLKLSWDAAYAGLSNAHRTALLEEGITVEKLGLPAEDAQLIESSKFSIEQMARFFDVPLIRLHSTTAVTSWGTGLEQWHRAYLVHTLNPWLVQWEETCNWALFRDGERATYFAEFLREALLQGDMAAKATYYGQMLMAGAISPNEIARKENLPSAGPAGDERYIPLNLIPLSRAAAASDMFGPRDEPEEEGPDDPDDEPPADPTEERARPNASDVEHATVSLRQQRAVTSRARLQEAHQRVYLQIAERIMAKHLSAARRAVDRLEKDNNIQAFQSWVREFFEAERSSLEEAFLPATLALSELVAADVLDELGSEAEIRTTVERFAALYVGALAARESGSSIAQLIRLTKDVKNNDTTVTQRLTQRLDEWQTSRPAQIAAREPVQAGNAVARHVYEQTGVQRLMWVARGSATCTLCQSMNGRIVSIARPFLAEGETVDGGDTKLTVDGSVSHPPLHKNCICQLVAA